MSQIMTKYKTNRPCLKFVRFSAHSDNTEFQHFVSLLILLHVVICSYVMTHVINILFRN